jgi:hypothetical protein
MEEEDERLTFGKIARCHSHYGTTDKASAKTTTTYIKHCVQKIDTLQGLALRYGVTVRCIAAGYEYNPT